MAQRLRLHPPLPLAAGTLARRRLVSILHPGRLCAAGSSRSSTPDALAPQARLDPPPGWRARRGLLPSARTAGCVVAFVIAELRAPSRSSTAGGATPHASQSCSREPPPPPLACPPRGAPLGLVAPAVTLAHASASASADRLSWATSRLQLGANLAADRTGRVFGVVSPVRVPCAVCCATRCGRTLLDFGAVPPRIDLE